MKRLLSGFAALLASFALLAAPLDALAADRFQRVILDDGTGVNPPNAPLGSAANPMQVTGVSGGGVAAAVTSIDGGIVTIGALADAAWSGSGNASVVAALKGIYNVVKSQVLSVTVNAPPNDVSTAATPFTGAGTLAVNTQGAGSASLQITGTFTGAAWTVQATDDGTNWVSPLPFYSNTSGTCSIYTAQPGTTTTGVWIIPAASYKQVRFNLTALSTGTLTATLNASAGSTQRCLTTTGTTANITGWNGVTPLAGNGATGTGSPRVTIASDNTPFNVNALGSAASTGGASTTGNIVANNTTAVVVQASATTLYGFQVYGLGSAPAYLKLYNATSATCGSGTPVKRIMIPAASTAANGAGANVSFFPGVAFGTGLTYCVTTGIADNDTTAPAASTFLVNLDWK